MLYLLHGGSIPPTSTNPNLFQFALSECQKCLETIEQKKISVRNGLQVMTKIDGKHVMSEIPSEQIKKTVDYLEKIRNFIITNNKIEIRGLKRERTKTNQENIVNFIDESTSNGVFLSEEISSPFYCDDAIIRASLRGSNGLPSFSTLTLLKVAEEMKIISLKERYNLQKKMADLGYGFLPIDAKFIFSQLKDESCNIEKISKIINPLVSKNTTIESLGIVLADLLVVVYSDLSINSNSKLKLFTTILKKAKLNHDLNKLEEIMLINLQRKLPSEKHEGLKITINLLFMVAAKWLSIFFFREIH